MATTFPFCDLCEAEHVEGTLVTTRWGLCGVCYQCQDGWAYADTQARSDEQEALQGRWGPP